MSEAFDMNSDPCAPIINLDPVIPSNANALLREQGLRPRKRWGQNFLCDRNVLDRIIRAAALEPDEHTLEIGAGLGSLTRSLADFCASVVSIEIDHLLEPILKRTLAGYNNVRMIYDDFLKMDMNFLLDEAFGDKPGVVVANIPYYITSPILERLMSHKSRIKRIVLLVQQEYAQRLCAAPGSDGFSAMSVYAQYHSRVEIAAHISRNVFLPPPEVSSSIVVFTPVSPATVETVSEEAFFRLSRAAFCKRRKTLANSLCNAETGLVKESALALLASAGIDPVRRGETLSLKEYAKLADEYTRLRETMATN
jgi:16S rRNA (adenine1518-N6/adenine1519-N6)-dimethyltransferase